MHFHRLIILLVIGLFLSACTAADEAIPDASTDEPISTDTPLSPTKTPLPTETFTPTFTVAAPTPVETATPRPVLQLCSPLAEQTLPEIPEIVSDPYDPPRPGKDDRHHGTDFAYYRSKDRTTIAGEGVQALMAGQVAAVIQDQLPYGNMVIIETHRSTLPPEMNTQFKISEGESLFILYAHFDSPPLVVLGEQINCGDPIGEVGVTGYNIVNPHLHIETRIGPAGTTFFDGMAYYDTRTTEG